MKNNKLSLTITMMVLVAAISVAVISCKKEHQEQKTSTEQSVQTSENLDDYLIAFKERLLSAKKGEETIGIEQAQRDLGNLLNFDFDDANFPTDVFQYDTIHIKTRQTQGLIDMSNLAIAYQESVDSILETYRSSTLPEKSIYCILCKFDDIQNTENDIVNIEIVVATRGYRNERNISDYDHDTLDWRPKNYAGSCDGQFINHYGGPEITERWIYQSRPIIGCINAGRIYFTDVDNWIIFGHHYYDYNTNRFRIYTSLEADQNSVCIPHDDMEYYWSQILDIYQQQSFGHHHIQMVLITHTRFWQTYLAPYNEILTFYTWKVYIRHGKPNCTVEPLPY